MMIAHRPCDPRGAGGQRCSQEVTRGCHAGCRRNDRPHQHLSRFLCPADLGDGPARPEAIGRRGACSRRGPRRFPPAGNWSGRPASNRRRPAWEGAAGISRLLPASTFLGLIIARRPSTEVSWVLPALRQNPRQKDRRIRVTAIRRAEEGTACTLEPALSRIGFPLRHH